ncbi:MAG: succinate dehydrogenase [Burkholderiaceae bacterium]
MSEMFEARLFMLQRASAMLLAPLVLVHLVLMFYAVHGGLSADEILARTRGNMLWAVFYGAFVVAVALHAPIGLRNLLREWTGLGSGAVNALSLAFGLLLLLLGARAVIGVVA